MVSDFKKLEGNDEMVIEDKGTNKPGKESN